MIVVKFAQLLTQFAPVLAAFVFAMSIVSRFSQPLKLFPAPQRSVFSAPVSVNPKLALSITTVLKNGQFWKAIVSIFVKFGKFQALALVSKLVIPEFLKAEFPIVVID